MRTGVTKLLWLSQFFQTETLYKTFYIVKNLIKYAEVPEWSNGTR